MSTAIRTSTFTQSRPSTIDLDQLGLKRHHVVALLEIDITLARSSLRVRNRGGGSAVSLLAWLAKSIAVSLARHPQAHVMRAGRRKIAEAADVTATLLVEREIEGIRVSLPFVVSSGDTGSLAEIEAAITRARTDAVDGDTIVIGSSRNRLITTLYHALPCSVRRWLLRRALSNSRRMNNIMGGVVITSVGMGGRIKGWFIPRTIHPVCIGIGAVTPKATVVNGTIAAREVLHLAVLVNHDVIDEAPAAKWISDLVRTLEQARELEDWQN